jgi:Flp pilus assembly protein TadG
MTLVRNFMQDRKGATAALMSIAMVPIVGTLAISIDYSKAVKQKYALQQVVDSTATALAKDTDVLLLSQTDLDARAKTYAQGVAGSIPVEDLNITVTAGEDIIHIDSDGKVKLTFGKVLGTDSLIVKASVTVQRAKAKKVELALALDNTGSMGGTKIKELKNAVRGLVDFMNDVTKNSGETRISLVPFTTYVRTDKAWMPNSILDGTPPSNWDGCVTDREQPNDVTDISPLSGGSTARHRFSKPGYVWNGSGYELKDTPISCGSLAQAIPLTSDLQVIKNAADTMIASGNTNVPIGIYWAWNSLTTTLPMTQASPKDTKDLVRAMIVLTDGDNTSNYWGGNGGNAIDKRMAEVCNNVKADGIILYTVRVLDGNAAALKSCATSTTHYYNITSADQLTPVFQQIAASLSKLRISQ